LTAIEGGETYEHLAKRLGRSKSSLYNMVYNARCKLKEAEERDTRPKEETK
jgi:transposase-like protein